MLEKMLTALKRLFSRETNATAESGERLEFQGTACVMVSGLTIFGAVSERLSPVQAVQLISDCTDRQLRIIERHGGKVEQFVGGSVVAYWLPDVPHSLASHATAAAREIVGALPINLPVECRLKVGFSVAECARAVLGPTSSFRIQVVGRARSRAETAFRSLSFQHGIAVNPETFALLSASDRALFQPGSDGNYVAVQR
jgi:class 3 adenylate cyclase